MLSVELCRYGNLVKETLVKSLVREVIALFGPQRCMFASNWHMHGAMSNTDSMDVIADKLTTLPQLYAKFTSWVSDLAADQRAALFSSTAKRFYRIA